MDQLTTALGVDEMEALFKFIPSDQLLGLRQVSEVCNEASLPVLRKREDLNFTLTEDAGRNKKFLEFLQNLSENGFVASRMKLKFKDELVGMPEEFAVTEGSSFNPFQEDLAAVCNIVGARRDVKKLTLEFPSFRINQPRRRLISSELLLRMIGHLSPSLEILDMEASGTDVDFALSQEAKDSVLELFRNSPLNNLKEIVPPSTLHLIIMGRIGFNDFVKWLKILVRSAPNLVEDPTAECRRNYEGETNRLLVLTEVQQSGFSARVYKSVRSRNLELEELSDFED